jgi:SAM-dependent methyltransferase
MDSTAKQPIPIANVFGWTSSIPNQVTCRWLEYLRTLRSPLTIDIGAGLGVATIPALECGSHVIANDISEEHLRQIASVAQQKGLSEELELLNAALPRLPPMKGLDAIHASNVLHFLTGDEMIEAARWMARSLKPNGRAFLQTISPFAGHFRQYLPEYERRKIARAAWPGEMKAPREYVDASVVEMTPAFMHVLESCVATQLFESAGFTIEFCDYYSRVGLPEVCRLDGRENLGIVAIKR